MGKAKKQICNRDCFNCVFDDCINDEMCLEDWKESREIEEFISPKTKRQKAIAAYQKDYLEKNREAIAAYKKDYREKNREALKEVHREYYATHKEYFKAYYRRKKAMKAEANV